MTPNHESYAAELRRLITATILMLSKHGYQRTAEKLEDALDRADALIGKGPYA